MTEPTCKDCRFATIANDTEGFCFRYPPVTVKENTSAYPPILLARWCGEFEQKAKPRSKTR